MNVGVFVSLTSDQPEHILAELECEIQRVLLVSYDDNLLQRVIIVLLQIKTRQNSLILINPFFVELLESHHAGVLDLKCLKVFCNLEQFFFFTKIGLLSKWKLYTGGVCFLWCGGWAYSAMGAFAFSCPLSLHCVFCAVAQLLGLVFLSLPVFASGGWGVSVGLHLLQGGPSQWASESPQPRSRQWSVGFVWWRYGECEKVFLFFSVCV